MYDFVWKTATPQETIDSGIAINTIIQKEFGPLHEDKEFVRGIAIFTSDHRLLDLRVLSVAAKGNNEGEMLDPEDDPLAIIERYCKALAAEDFMIWTLGDDENLQDPEFISTLIEAAQTFRDSEGPHEVRLRGMLIVGRSPGTGGFAMTDAQSPSPGSPSWVWHMTKEAIEREKKMPGGPNPDIMAAMVETLAALKEHRERDMAILQKALKASQARLGEHLKAELSHKHNMPKSVLELLGLEQPAEHPSAASPFDLPKMQLPKPEKGLLN